MKKTAIIIVTGIIIAGIALYSYTKNFVVNSLENYEPYRFSTVLDYDSMRADYGISWHNSPSDYGFETVEEIEFVSFKDSIQLSSWYLPTAKDKNSCIVIAHGRTSNRLKTMKFAEMLRNYGLDTAYNICIPDFRNSGKSEASKTYMGYKFAEDIASTVFMLNEKFGFDDFIIYGFSMGAMGTVTALGRDDISEVIQQKNIDIKAVILDSPLANVKEIVKYNSKDYPIPLFLVKDGYDKFCAQIGPYGEKLTLHDGIRDYTGPVLILQSVDDAMTPYYILEKELNKLEGREKLYVELFEKSDHVKMYQDSLNHEQYVETVTGFINNL